jgi:hydrogenase maturation protease
MTVLPTITVAAAGHFMVQHDTIGPRVLTRIEGRYPDAEVEVVDLGTSGLALLDRLRGQRLLVVVDACVGLGAPGALVERRYDPDQQQAVGRETSVHQLGPLEALQIARELYPAQLPNHTVLLLVDTNGADDAALEAASARVVERLDELLSRANEGAV